MNLITDNNQPKETPILKFHHGIIMKMRKKRVN